METYCKDITKDITNFEDRTSAEVLKNIQFCEPPCQWLLCYQTITVTNLQWEIFGSWNMLRLMKDGHRYFLSLICTNKCPFQFWNNRRCTESSVSLRIICQGSGVCSRQLLEFAHFLQWPMASTRSWVYNATCHKLDLSSSSDKKNCA